MIHRPVKADPAIHHRRGIRSDSDEYLVPQKTVPKFESDLVSPLPGKDNQVPPPSAIGSDEFKEQWEDLNRCRSESKAGIYPAWFFQKYNPILTGPWANAGGLSPILKDHFLAPENIGSYRQLSNGEPHPENLGELVRMDKTDLFGMACVHYGLKHDLIELKPENDRTPGHDSWMDYEVEFNAVLSRAIADAMTAGFETKSEYKGCRPSEYAERNLGIPENMLCQYPEPNHPRYPAGHGSNFGGSAAAIDLFFNYKGDKARQEWSRGLMHYTLIQGANSRSVSYMHLPEDNVQGFLLGWRTVAGRAYPHGTS